MIISCTGNNCVGNLGGAIKGLPHGTVGATTSHSPQAAAEDTDTDTDELEDEEEQKEEDNERL